MVWEEGWYFDLEGGEQQGFFTSFGASDTLLQGGWIKVNFPSLQGGVHLRKDHLETMYSFSSDVFWIDKTVGELGPLREAASVWLLRVQTLVDLPCL